MGKSRALAAGVAGGLVSFTLAISVAAPAAAQISVQVEQGTHLLGDVVGGQVEVTVSVAHRGRGVLENALLVLPAPAATELLASSELATADGDALVFPLGSLVEGDAAVLRLTVRGDRLGEIFPAPLVHGSWQGRPLLGTGRAVVLHDAGFPVAELLPTPDADPSDPPIAAQAALLGHDPTRIFRFVQQDVVHQPYAGSLHGARGALYGLAGNSVDRSNLLVALLRAAGVPAAYRRGTLDAASVNRLYAGLFPGDGGLDRAGPALDLAALRAEPGRLLSLVPPESMPGLGVDVPTRLAAIAALDDAALRALLLEPTIPDAARAAILADHVWVDAYLDGAWTALDPSFRDAVAGEVVATPLAGGRTAAIPESLRHHLVVRLVPESYEPAWGQPPTLAPAVLELTRGAGDLVGRQLTTWQRNDRVTSSGFFFFTQSSTYVPMLEISDLELLGTPEQLEGQALTEFTSNFAGGLANSYATALFAQVELLAPGQLAGQGQLLQRAAADRLGLAARAGLPYSSDDLDLGQPLIDPTDVTTLTIGSAPLPARLARSAQLVLGSLITQAQAALPAMEASPQADLTDEQRELLRAFSGQLAGTLALLHRGNLGERTRLISQGLLERPFALAPNVVASAFHVTQDGAAHHRFDLLRDELDAVGPPGQLLTQRRTFRGAYGYAATMLESAVLETLGAGVATSAARILEQAEASGIPVVYLSGQLGRAMLLDEGVSMPHEAALRLYAALDQGKSAFVPTEPVVIGGVPRTGWLEVAPDGSILGRLEDGSGGGAVEYAVFLVGLACDMAGRTDAVQDCPPSAMGFAIKMIQATGSLFGLVAGAFGAVDACTGGAWQICQKLQTDFAPLARTITSQAFGENGAAPFEQCTVPIALLASAANTLPDDDPLRALACPSCWSGPLYGPFDVIENVVNGYCAATESVARSINAVTAAMTDPLLPALPGGVMDADPTDPADRATATGSVVVAATLPPDARVQALQDSLAALRAALGAGPATAAAIAELDAASARLTAEGCAAAQDPSLLAALATSLDAATRGPNLVAALTLPASVLNGTQLVIAGEIRNGGDADAPASDAQLLLRRGADAAVILGTVAIPAIAPGEAAPVSLQWDTTAALGSYVISLRADVGGVVAELDEANQVDRVIQILPAAAAPGGNLPPVFSSAPVLVAGVAQPYLYAPVLSDPEGDPIFLDAPVRPRGLRLAGGRLVGELPRVGSHVVVLVAVDRYGASASQQFTIVATDAVATPSRRSPLARPAPRWWTRPSATRWSPPTPTAIRSW